MLERFKRLFSGESEAKEKGENAPEESKYERTPGLSDEEQQAVDSAALILRSVIEDNELRKTRVRNTIALSKEAVNNAVLLEKLEGSDPDEARNAAIVVLGERYSQLLRVQEVQSDLNMRARRSAIHESKTPGTATAVRESSEDLKKTEDSIQDLVEQMKALRNRH
jgi:hypothetical protein